MKPQYVANKSAWAGVSVLCILFFFLVIPVIVMICRIIAIKKYALEFYEDKIVIKSGWLNTKKKQMVFMGVTAVSTEQSLWGKIFGYGNVLVDCVGKWDVSTTQYIKNPEKLEEYLQTRIVSGASNGGASPFRGFVEM